MQNTVADPVVKDPEMSNQQAALPIKLFNAESRTLIEGREHVKARTMLECLTDGMDAARRTDQPEAPTALVAAASQQLIINKKKNSPQARALKTVDPMEDEGVWCVLDTACNATGQGE